MALTSQLFAAPKSIHGPTISTLTYRQSKCKTSLRRQGDVEVSRMSYALGEAFTF